MSAGSRLVQLSAVVSFFTLTCLFLVPTSVEGQVAEMSLDPLISFVSCVQQSRPGYCFRERALSYFESWLTKGEDDDDEAASEDGNAGDGGDEVGSRLSPYWKSMVDNVAQRIAGLYGEDEEEKDEADGSNKGKQLTDQNDTSIQGRRDSESEGGRGHHKKKKLKAIKKAIIKLVLIALLIKSKLKMLLTAFQTFLQFKAVALATIYVLIHVVKLWVEIKHKHHPQKVIYYENAHHQHHYDHHDDHHHDWDDHSGGGGGGWSLWGRSGVAGPTTSTTPFPLASFLGRAAASTSADLPYAAHIPK